MRAIDNGRMIVTLTVGELRSIIREEVQRAYEAWQREQPERALVWVGPEEIQKRFGISRGTVHNWIRNEGCPHDMRGKILRFQISAVEAWFAAGRARKP